jgi:hypothetical protein
VAVAGFQYTPVRVNQIDPSKTGNADRINEVLHSSLKAWSDFIKNNPVKQTIQASSAIPVLPGKIISATTTPTSQLVNPNTPTPHQAARDWMNAGPSQEIKDKYIADNVKQENGPGFWGRTWNDIGHFLGATRDAIIQSMHDNPVNVIKQGPLQEQLQGSVTSKTIASAKKGATEGTPYDWRDVFHIPKSVGPQDPIFDAFIEHQKEHGSRLEGIQAKTSDILGRDLANAGLKIGGAAVEFAGDTLTNPLTYVPAGWASRLAGPLLNKIPLAARGAEIIAAKDAAEATAQTGTQTVNIAGQQVPGAVDPAVAAQAAATTAKDAHDKTIADQLADFEPLPDTKTHITQATEPIPHAGTATTAESSQATATANLADAMSQGKPVSESLIATFASDPGVKVVRHPTLGVVDIPTLDAHMKTIRTKIDVTRASHAAAVANNSDASVIKVLQKRLKDATKEFNVNLKIKKSMSETPTGSNAAAQVKPEATAGVSGPVVPPEPPVAVETPTAAPVVSTHRPEKEIVAEQNKHQATMDKITKQLQNATGPRVSRLEDQFDEAAQKFELARIELNKSRADAATQPISEQMLAAAKPQVDPITEVHADIGQGAKDILESGNAPEPIPHAARKDAVSTEHLRPNAALRTRGRPGFPMIRDATTGLKSALKDGGSKYMTTIDQSSAFKDAYQKVVLPHLKKFPDLQGLERAQLGEDVYGAMLHKYKEDGLAAGWQGYISENAGSPKLEAGAHPLWISDVHDIALKYEGNPHFITAPSYNSARDMVVPQGAQLVAAAKAMNLAHSGLSEAEKIAQIVATMRTAGEKSTFAQSQKSYLSFAKAMVDGTPDLLARAKDNLAGIISRRIDDAETILTRANDELTAATSGPNASRTTALKAKADMAGNVAAIAEEIGAHPGAAEAAAHGHGLFAAHQGIDDVEVAAARTEIGNNNIVDKTRPTPDGGIPPKAQAALDQRNQRQAKLIDDDTDAVLTRTMTPPEVETYANEWDVSQRSVARRNRRLNASLESIRTGVERGNFKAGTRVAKDIQRQARDGGTVRQNYFSESIEKIRKQIPENDPSAQVAMTAIQKGTVPDGLLNPNAALAHKLMEEQMSNLFETKIGSEAKFGLFFSKQHTLKQLNDEMAHMGLKFRFDPKKVDSKDPEFWNKVYDQWRTWDFGADPLTTMKQLFNSMVSGGGRKHIGLEVARTFGSLVPTAEKPIRLRNSAKKQFITQYIPENTYFSEAHAMQIRDLELNMVKSNRFGTTYAAGRFMNNTWIPVMNLLKQTQTILRPSFLLHNISGDYFANGMVDNVWNPIHYERARDLLSSLGLEIHSATNVDKALRGLSAMGEKDYMTIKLANGVSKTISKGDVLQGNLEVGIIKKFYHEDEFTRDMLAGTTLNTPSVVGRTANKIASMKPMKYMGDLATKSSMFTNLAQMDKLLRDSSFTQGFKTQAEAFSAAAARVMYTHPDPGALTHFEAKYMRLLIPFYTWQRSMIAPTVLMTLNNPRHVVMFVNLMEALNTIAGSNEGNEGNTGDQWDTGTLRPDFISSNMFGAPGNIGGITRKIIGGGGIGSGGQSVGGDLGSPLESLIGQSGLLSGTSAKHPGFGGALAGIIPRALAQTSPLIQAPLALMTGTKLTDSGVLPIKNAADFIDNMIPFANTASDVSGTSFSGTLFNLLKGDPKWAKQAAVAKGDKKQWANISLLNQISPVKLSDPNTKSLHAIALKQLLAKEGMSR